MPPFKKQKEDMTLPERREMIDWLKDEIRQFKEDIALHPTVEALRLHLLQHEVKLAWLEGEDKKPFSEMRDCLLKKCNAQTILIQLKHGMRMIFANL